MYETYVWLEGYEEEPILNMKLPHIPNVGDKFELAFEKDDERVKNITKVMVSDVLQTINFEGVFSLSLTVIPIEFKK